MYWNTDCCPRKWSTKWLIETWDVLKCQMDLANALQLSRLIETWDVLKWRKMGWKRQYWKINRNMRCIEILNPDEDVLFGEINRNMRCIEILPVFPSFTLTFWINRNMRCIEIRFPAAMLPGPPPINRNMRCIEIRG